MSNLLESLHMFKNSQSEWKTCLFTIQCWTYSWRISAFCHNFFFLLHLIYYNLSAWGSDMNLTFRTARTRPSSGGTTDLPYMKQVYLIKWPTVRLTQPKQNGRHLPQGPTWRVLPVFRLWPAYSGTVQPGVDVVAAQRLGLGHQLLVGGRAVEHFCRKNRGAAQHLHVQMLQQQLLLRLRFIRRAMARSQPPLSGRPSPTRRLAVARRWEHVWRLSCI